MKSLKSAVKQVVTLLVKFNKFMEPWGKAMAQVRAM